MQPELNSQQGAAQHVEGPAAGRPFQFALRTLFVMTAGLCGLCAILAQVSRPWAAVTLWTVVLVAGHVFATFRGTQLKLRRPRSARGCAPRRRKVDWSVLPPASALRRRDALSRKMLCASALGAVVGGVAGVTVLALGWLGSSAFAGILLGGASAAVLGGFFGFLTGSFVEVTGRVLASRDDR